MGPMYEKKTVEFGSVASDSLLCKETKRAYISQLKTFEECQHFVRSHCIPGPCVVWCQAHDVFFNYSQNMYLNVLLIVNYLLFFQGALGTPGKSGLPGLPGMPVTVNIIYLPTLLQLGLVLSVATHLVG